MGMEKINNKIIDKIADETYENRSLYEKDKQAEPETQRVSAFDNDVEDLIRAKESAKLAFPEFESIEDKRLRECNYGDLDGGDKNQIVYEDHIDNPFPNGESLKDVEKRIKEFLDYVNDNYKDKTIGIIAHRAPQLAIEVITKGISWEEANLNDWRKTGDWQPGWEYELK